MRIAECGSRNKHAEDFYEEAENATEAGRSELPSTTRPAAYPSAMVRGPDANAWVSGVRLAREAPPFGVWPQTSVESALNVWWRNERKLRPV